MNEVRALIKHISCSFRCKYHGRNCYPDQKCVTTKTFDVCEKIQ